MRKIIKYVVLPLTILIFCIFSFWAYNIWRGAEDSAYMSCLGSVANEIQKLDDTKALIPKDSNWKILSADETNLLMQKVHGGDCSNFDNPVLDLWNHRINIALRKSSNYPEIIIWSNGKDNISGTDDDLVMPYGVKVPK